MQTPTSNARKYDVTQYDGREVTVTRMTAAEVQKIKPQAFDYFISTRDAILAFRTAAGKWIEYRNKWPGVGPVGLAILRSLQMNFGDFLTPEDIAELTGINSLKRNEVLAARSCRLRKTHADKSQRFIETRTADRFAIRWPRERTWLWVDRAPVAAIDKPLNVDPKDGETDRQ
jgi:hypothetical protein